MGEGERGESAGILPFLWHDSHTLFKWLMSGLVVVGGLPAVYFWKDGMAL
jgi:hypothetical protein